MWSLFSTKGPEKLKRESGRDGSGRGTLSRRWWAGHIEKGVMKWAGFSG